jgi:alpha-galactosidase
MQSLPMPQSGTTQVVRSDQVQIELSETPVQVFRHGWQSWSLAAWTDLAPLPVQKPAIFHALQTDAVFIHERLPNGSWVGAVELAGGDILLLGALGLDTHVTLEGNRLSGRCESSEVEWLIARGSEREVFGVYADALGDRLGKATVNSPAPRVWCSWYSLYTAIDETVLGQAFAGLADLPFDVLQVDDGWQARVGDWQANAKFSSGMAALAGKIRTTGRRAGLWLAPLLAVRSSRLFHEHPDWFLRDEDGRYVSAGFNWGEPLYALDTTRLEVDRWLADLMKQVRSWGFDYIKLDFLYAGALKGVRSRDVPREAAFRQALATLRSAMGPDAFFLTCGTPILPTLGLCDAIRIGPDVGGVWESDRDAKFFSNPSTPGTKNAIRTVLGRLWLQPIMRTDPDVAYFAPVWNELTPDQRRLLQDLALVCGFKATSDLPQWLDDTTRAALRSFLEASPAVERLDRATFCIDGRRVDFSPALPLPPAPQGFTALEADVLGWLGSQPAVLKIFNALQDREYRKRRGSL